MRLSGSGRLPLTLSGIAFTSVAIGGYTLRPDQDMHLNYETIGPNYFRTVRIPLLRGRPYFVTARTRELGIRISIGAQRMDVLKLILRKSLTLTTIGVLGGLLVALTLTRLTAHLLYGVSATDHITFTLVALLLIGIAPVATCFPARCATSTDAMIALRHD